MAGVIFLVPVALGNSGWTEYLPQATRDITCELRYFVVENAKTARAELKRIGHPQALRDLSIEQLPEQPRRADIDRLLQPLSAGHDIAVMSEAGCPGVADPGALLVQRAHELGIAVRPLIGPSSLLLGLMASGLNGQRFAFHGYLPAREPERGRHINRLEAESAREGQTQLFIETPYRNTAMFEALLKTCRPQTQLCVAADLTLPTEFVLTQRIEAWRRAERPALDKRPTVFLFLA